MHSKIITGVLIIVSCLIGFLYFVVIDSTSRKDEVKTRIEENFSERGDNIVEE